MASSGRMALLACTWSSCSWMSSWRKLSSVRTQYQRISGSSGKSSSGTHRPSFVRMATTASTWAGE
eukprot:9766473-Alexandrium_andersonii.AAC.1